MSEERLRDIATSEYILRAKNDMELWVDMIAEDLSEHGIQNKKNWKENIFKIVFFVRLTSICKVYLLSKTVLIF